MSTTNTPATSADTHLVHLDAATTSPPAAGTPPRLASGPAATWGGAPSTS